MEGRSSTLETVDEYFEMQKLKTSKIGLLLVIRRRQIYRLTELSGDVASGDILLEHSSIFE